MNIKTKIPMSAFTATLLATSCRTANSLVDPTTLGFTS
ncbi:hypothetical protein SAMN00790413_04934 [Deinococcus hopiensis KR-140]|uniref:Uncharacterized protein n=1 Tax=Deinococcus hopiensis KR-140 TaxID=695939 RepID=A0A1W1USD4_9DEIO|nr:hypothetical protein SAMN00790413_04934 [Deinococcus hopiensis KR-140]